MHRTLRQSERKKDEIKKNCEFQLYLDHLKEPKLLVRDHQKVPVQADVQTELSSLVIP